MSAYYNEIDPAAAHILRALIAEGVIADGDVDTRPIQEVQPSDVRGYTQCHFFAGGGLWSVAARLAGWPDHAPLWTGSCPCQPFSAAGKGLGTDDPRHLWPDFYRLICACRPAVVMGEQVAGKAGYGWFDGVRADLAGEDFATRAVDFPACSVDAPHQRNRLYWIAVEHAEGERWREGRAEPEFRSGRPTIAFPNASGGAGLLAGHAGERRAEAIGEPGDRAAAHGQGPANWTEHLHGNDCGIVEADGAGAAGHLAHCADEPFLSGRPREARCAQDPNAGTTRALSGREFAHIDGVRSALRNRTYWSDAEWIKCHDGKARRAQSGIRFLVNGLPGRVDLWRVGGNAIVPEAAAEVIAAFMDVYGVPASDRRAAA